MNHKNEGSKSSSIESIQIDPSLAYAEVHAVPERSEEQEALITDIASDLVRLNEYYRENEELIENARQKDSDDRSDNEKLALEKLSEHNRFFNKSLNTYRSQYGGLEQLRLLREFAARENIVEDHSLSQTNHIAPTQDLLEFYDAVNVQEKRLDWAEAHGEETHKHHMIEEFKTLLQEYPYELEHQNSHFANTVKELFHRMPKEVVETYFERKLEWYVAQEKPVSRFGGPNLFDLVLDGPSQKDFETYGSFNDKLFEVFGEKLQEDMDDSRAEALHEYQNVIDQNPQVLSPDVYFEVSAEIQASHQIDPFFKSAALHGLNYGISFFGSGLQERLSEKLDFTDPDRFHKTGILLDTIRNIHGLDEGYSQGKIEPVFRDAISGALDRGEGSFFLRLRAQETLDKIERGDIWPDGDRVPFKFSNDEYAIQKNDGLYVSRSENFDEVEQLLADLSDLEEQLQPPQELIDEAIAAGQDSVYWQPDQKLSKQYQSVRTELYKICDHRITAEDLTLGADISSNEREALLYNFEYMHRLSVRKKVEEKFGCELSELRPAERFYFLDYVRDKNASEIDELSETMSIFGSNGLRTFLGINQEGQDFSEVILKIARAETLDDKVKSKIFEKYAAIVGASERAREYVHGATGAELDETYVKDIAADLRAKANALLTTAEGKIEHGEVDELLIQLEAMSDETLLFSSAFKELKREGATLEDFKNFKREILPAREALGRGLLDPMITIYVQNYRNLGYPDHAIDQLVASFKEHLAQENTKLYVWKVGDEILSFSLAEERENNEVYISGLNVNPELKIAQAGKGIIDELFRDYRDKGKTLLAEASPENAEGYTALGFIGTNRKEDDLQVEPYMIDVALHKDWVFASKDIKRSAVMRALADVDTVIDGNTLMYRTNDPTVTPNELGSSHVLTQSFKRTKDEKTTHYFVLERADVTEFQRTATSPQTQIAA